MSDYLLDTNHASAILDGDEPITSRVASSQKTGDRFGISMTVLGELYYEAYASRAVMPISHALRILWHRSSCGNMIKLLLKNSDVFKQNRNAKVTRFLRRMPRLLLLPGNKT